MQRKLVTARQQAMSLLVHALNRAKACYQASCPVALVRTPHWKISIVNEIRLFLSFFFPQSLGIQQHGTNGWDAARCYGDRDLWDGGLVHHPPDKGAVVRLSMRSWSVGHLAPQNTYQQCWVYPWPQTTLVVPQLVQQHGIRVSSADGDFKRPSSEHRLRSAPIAPEALQLTRKTSTRM